MPPLQNLVRVSRAQFTPTRGTAIRIVSESQVIKERDALKLAHYVADRAPLFYRDLSDIIGSLSDGYMLTTIKETLAKLPDSEKFQESHFAEIISGIFAEEVMGLRRLYSKLSFLTAENANAYKMDLVMADLSGAEVVFVFGEVKGSMKTARPAGHDASCFASLFQSINGYEAADKEFDLAAIKDRLGTMPEADRERIRMALKPYSEIRLRYVGFAVIDMSTKDDEEANVLACREAKKEFSAELLCVETLKDVVLESFGKLQALKKECSA